MDQQKMGKFISMLRKEKGLTQQELAEKLGITDKAVSKWERGLGCPDISLLTPISELFDVSINELLLGERKKIGTDDIEEINRNILEYSSNEISFNKSKTKRMKFSFVISFSILIVMILCFAVNTFKEVRAEKEMDEYVNHIEEYLKELNFKKDNPLRSPNSLLTIDGVTYVVPKIMYKDGNKNEIYKEILSYSDYENFTGLIIYYNGKQATAYEYEDIGSKKASMTSLDVNPNSGRLIKGKKYSEKQKQFYNDKRLEIEDRISHISTMWHNIYGD